ncbi:MAG: hydroxymethylbilane synthase, partial [Burkholderiaceae bacterium]
HEQTWREVSAERAVSRALGGSCQVPLAAFCEQQGDGPTLRLRARIAMPNGAQLCAVDLLGPDPEALGAMAADALRAQGADRIIQALSADQ